jgi:hypothetical protein
MVSSSTVVSGMGYDPKSKCYIFDDGPELEQLKRWYDPVRRLREERLSRSEDSKQEKEPRLDVPQGPGSDRRTA